MKQSVSFILYYYKNSKKKMDFNYINTLFLLNIAIMLQLFGRFIQLGHIKNLF
jgi:hypothetical protein